MHEKLNNNNTDDEDHNDNDVVASSINIEAQTLLIQRSTITLRLLLNLLFMM
jgi:hypothetical protein